MSKAGDIRSFFKTKSTVRKSTRSAAVDDNVDNEAKKNVDVTFQSNGNTNLEPKSTAKPKKLKKSIARVTIRKGAAVKKRKSKDKKAVKIIKSSKTRCRKAFKKNVKEGYIDSESSSGNDDKENSSYSSEDETNDNFSRRKSSSSKPMIIDVSESESENEDKSDCIVKVIKTTTQRSLDDMMKTMPKKSVSVHTQDLVSVVSDVDPNDFFADSTAKKIKTKTPLQSLSEPVISPNNVSDDETLVVNKQHTVSCVKVKPDDVKSNTKASRTRNRENIASKPISTTHELNNGDCVKFIEAKNITDVKPPSTSVTDGSSSANKTVSPKSSQVSIPEGAPECLHDLKFVFTGDLDSLSRDDAKDLVKKYGAKVTTAITGATNYMVVGINPGPSKLEKAKQYSKLIQLNEHQLFALISSRKPLKQITTPLKTNKSVTNLKSVKPRRGEYNMWVDKYRPQCSANLIGNPSIIKQLHEFLSSWRPGAGKNAALLSGPPGIGKTSAACILAKECGYETIELNASDARSKKIISSKLEHMIGTQSITNFFEMNKIKPKGNHQLGKKSSQQMNNIGKNTVLIMDEVDGMSSGDRGGIQELISLLKLTKIPIICICNDRNSPRIRTLANYCADFRFRRPTAMQVKARISSIAQAEGIRLDAYVAEKLSESTRGDIRQMLHTLQLWNTGSTNSVSFDKAKASLESASKDFTVGAFDVVPKMFASFRRDDSRWMNERMDAYFVDPSIVPIMVQGAYLDARICLNDQERNAPSAHRSFFELSRYAAASHFISDGDLIDRRIHSTQSYELMPAHAALSSVAPTVVTGGGLASKLDFPAWMGKNSTRRKNQRQSMELRMHMSKRVTGDSTSMVIDYLPVFRQRLFRPLADNGSAGISEVVMLMFHYGINRDDFDAIAELGQSFIHDKMNISGKIKASLTRAFNAKTGNFKRAVKRKRKLETNVIALKFDDIVEDSADEDSLNEGEDKESEVPIKTSNKKAKKMKSNSTRTKDSLSSSSTVKKRLKGSRPE